MTNKHVFVAPVFMIGEKGADMIKELWLQKTEEENRYKRQFNSTYSNVTIS